MNYRSLTRDGNAVNATLMEVGDALVTKEGCKIYIPARFLDRQLAYIGSVVRVAICYAIVVGDKYAVACAQSMMNIFPDSTTMVDFDGESYYEFSFEKGSQITDNVNTVIDDQYCYKVFDEIEAKGKHPWYLNYEDLGKLFISSDKHAGVTFYANNAPWECLVAMLARKEEDRTVYYRHVVKTEADKLITPVIVPFRSVIYNTHSTSAKLNGSHFDDGTLSALVHRSDKVEGVEALLRS